MAEEKTQDRKEEPMSRKNDGFVWEKTRLQ